MLHTSPDTLRTAPAHHHGTHTGQHADTQPFQLIHTAAAVTHQQHREAEGIQDQGDQGAAGHAEDHVRDQHQRRHGQCRTARPVFSTGHDPLHTAGKQEHAGICRIVQTHEQAEQAALIISLPCQLRAGGIGIGDICIADAEQILIQAHAAGNAPDDQHHIEQVPQEPAHPFLAHPLGQTVHQRKLDHHPAQVKKVVLHAVAYGTQGGDDIHKGHAIQQPAPDTSPEAPVGEQIQRHQHSAYQSQIGGNVVQRGFGHPRQHRGDLQQHKAHHRHAYIHQHRRVQPRKPSDTALIPKYRTPQFSLLHMV